MTPEERAQDVCNRWAGGSGGELNTIIAAELRAAVQAERELMGCGHPKACQYRRTESGEMYGCRSCDDESAAVLSHHEAVVGILRKLYRQHPFELLREAIEAIESLRPGGGEPGANRERGTVKARLRYAGRDKPMAMDDEAEE